MEVQFLNARVFDHFDGSSIVFHVHELQRISGSVFA